MWYNNGRAIITFQWPGRVVRFAHRPMANYTITLALHGIITAKRLLYFNGVRLAPLALPAAATGEVANYTITLALHGIIPTKVAATGRAAIPFPKANRELTEHNAILKEAQYKLWKDRTKP